MLNSIVVIVITSLSLMILFNNKIKLSPTWRATVTPLASIIGSGFLVSAPLLILSTGYFAPIAMGVIVVIAYGLGSSMRFNISHAEAMADNKKLVVLNNLELISRITLSVAYLISITFYLKLLSAFFLKGMGIDIPLAQNIITTIIFLFIGLTGKFKGLSSLESLEVYSVNIKISIIVALVVSHLIFNFDLMSNGQWTLKIYPHEKPIDAIQKLLGMLVIIQGFETSRYLKGAYSVDMRVRTMKHAQIISGVIYVIFILSTLTAFNDIHQISETTVVDVCRMIAPALPFMLIIAAIMSQFSAAIADTIGSGGLIQEASRNKISLNNSYVLIIVIGICLTWLTNIYSIITIASKAFAIYYALQLCVSLYVLKKVDASIKSNLKQFIYTSLLVLMTCVVVFGVSVEAGGH